MQIATQLAKSILTPQRAGFLASPPYPFTHTLSAYTGCGFGQTTCGLYCYAQFMPNWTITHANSEWGRAVSVKANAADLLDHTLRQMRTAQRQRLRIFMSSTTDPYQPAEATYRVTRQCLEVFTRYTDLDLLVIQTRGPLVTRDFDIIRQIPYAWLSMTIETDDHQVLQGLRGGPLLSKRFAAVREAHQHGIPTQIAVSPCLPYTATFAATLAGSGADRVVVDNCVDGDGAKGERTARARYGELVPDWHDTVPSQALFDQLVALSVDVGWSATGFCGIAPRTHQTLLSVCDA